MIEVTHQRMSKVTKSTPRNARKKRSEPKKKPRVIGADTGEYIAKAFSDIELLVAADVIQSALSESKRHVDVEALRRVLARLKRAYEWKAQHRKLP